MTVPAPNNNYNNNQQALLPNAADVASMIRRETTHFARNHPIFTGGYLLGLLVLVFGTTGRQLTVEQTRQYDRILNTIDLRAEEDARVAVWHAQEQYRHTKGGLFTLFHCDATCQKHKQRMNTAEKQLQALVREREARMIDAKRSVGVFSTIALDDIKYSFWGYFDSAKAYAKRRSMWDLIWMGVLEFLDHNRRSRDESMLEFALKFLVQVLINFSAGLVTALTLFVVGLYSLVRSYASNPLVAVLAFVLASLAAFAFVATYFMAMMGAAGASVYAVLQLADSRRNRLNNSSSSRNSGRNQIPQQQRRPHSE